MWSRKIATLLSLVIVPVFVFAEDLGLVGQTYPIVETDFLDFIQARLKAMQVNGDLVKIQDQFKLNVSKHIDRPGSVAGISKAVISKSWFIDPSITVPYDLMDPLGHIFARQGTTLNPLFYITIHHSMVFINGDDIAQIKWLKNNFHENAKEIKVVLVGGSVIEMAKLLQQPVYFDQEGRLTDKFHIKHVPAIVSQQAHKLKVMEIAV